MKDLCSVFNCDSFAASSLTLGPTSHDMVNIKKKSFNLEHKYLLFKPTSPFSLPDNSVFSLPGEVN